MQKEEKKRQKRLREVNASTVIAAVVGGYLYEIQIASS